MPVLKILHCAGSMDPRGGGPVSGILSLCDSLVSLGHVNELMCTDIEGKPWLDGLEFPCHAMGPVFGKFAYSTRMSEWMMNNVDRFDAVIVHGVWQFTAYAAWKACKQHGKLFYVFSHGGLTSGSGLGLIKQKLFWSLIQKRIMNDANGILFTTEQERAKVVNRFSSYKCREVVVGFGISVPESGRVHLAKRFKQAYPLTAGKRLCIYLGRLDRIKGCDMLIEALARVAPDVPDLMLVMASPVEGEIYEMLVDKIKSLGLENRVLWTGWVSGAMKWGVISSAEALILPSHHENFGVVVAEALGLGIPALITDKVGTWPILQEYSAGLIAEDTVEGITSLLNGWFTMSEEDRALVGKNTRNCYEENFNMKATASRIASLIEGE